jgi:hypothetical protein
VGARDGAAGRGHERRGWATSASRAWPTLPQDRLVGLGWQQVDRRSPAKL